MMVVSFTLELLLANIHTLTATHLFTLLTVTLPLDNFAQNTSQVDQRQIRRFSNTMAAFVSDYIKLSSKYP